MIDTFKKYCKLKGINHKYGYMRKDENEKLFIETFEGEKITHLAYQHSPRHKPHYYFKYVNKLISVSKATCGYTEKCQVGKPNIKCVETKIYSPNKCAVAFAELVELNDFEYNLTHKELNEMNK